MADISYPFTAHTGQPATRPITIISPVIFLQISAMSEFLYFGMQLDLEVKYVLYTLMVTFNIWKINFKERFDPTEWKIMWLTNYVGSLYTHFHFSTHKVIPYMYKRFQSICMMSYDENT